MASTIEDRQQSLFHIGNGKPCRFFNRSSCLKGSLCDFMHAPDEHSLRLSPAGPNICLAHLVRAGGCSIGESKYWYSHDLASGTDLPLDDADALPQTLEQIIRMPKYERHMICGNFIKSRGEGEPVMDVAEMNGEGIMIKLRGKHNAEVRPKSQRRSGKRRRGMGGAGLYGLLGMENFGMDNGGYMGWSQDDMMELASQGVKPWDDDARDVLAFLHGY